MAAEDLIDLHNFQQHFESAVKSGMLALVGETVIVSREYADPDISLPDECLSVIFANPDAVEVRQAGATGLGMEWAGYTADLIFMVRTFRDDDAPVLVETVQTSHNALLAKVRAAMLYQSEIFTGRLPYYDVVEVKPGAQVWDSEEEVRVDQTTLPYAIQFIIRKDAWPAIV